MGICCCGFPSVYYGADCFGLMSNWTRFIAGFDVHGDKQNKAACEVFFRFMKDWKPEIRVMGGDLFDFLPLRRKASEEECHARTVGLMQPTVRISDGGRET